jgi:hypothetical protein
LKDEQFLAKLFKAVDYLSDWFGWFIGAAHDASRILFVEGVSVRHRPELHCSFRPPLFVGFPEGNQILYAPHSICNASGHRRGHAK